MKKYYFAVYDVHFYKVDEDGNELLNDDGRTKLFFPNTNVDYSYLADDVNPDDLVELKS
jgi:superfamily I DNA and RNA helicase